MPLFRSTWTETQGHYHNMQIRDKGFMSRCADYELNAAECLEAYGYYRAERYCKDYLDDLEECGWARKQVSSKVS